MDRELMNFLIGLTPGKMAAFERDQETIDLYRQMYRSRLSLIIRLLTGRGMRLALEPAAGFFTLWLAPTHAFGKHIESAEHFNFMMIEETGVVGVHFPPYVRYAVCGDVEAMGNDIDAAFARANVSYQ